MAASKNKICNSEHGGQFTRKYVLIYYNQFLISAINGITKDFLSLQYERSM